MTNNQLYITKHYTYIALVSQPNAATRKILAVLYASLIAVKNFSYCLMNVLKKI